MARLKELQDKKLSLVSQLRGEIDSLTDEAYERIEADLTSTEKAIKRELDLQSYEESLRQVTAVPELESPATRVESKQADDAKRYEEAFETLLRTPMNSLNHETRAVLNTGTGSEGGFLAPEVYLTTVINKLLDRNVVRQVANVVRTSATTYIPLGNSRPTFSLIAENGAYGTTDASFAQKVLKAFKIGGILQASDELMRDSFTDIQAYLTNLIVEGVADQEEIYFTTGAGTTEPTGILTGGELGKTTVAVGAVTLDEVLDLKYSLKAPYRMNANFMMNSSTEKAVRKLKDTQGQYLWQPSLQVGAPNTFDGKPILINEKIPSLGTGNKFMAFGDFKYFMIGDRGGMEIKRLDELYAENGQVGWRVSKSFDSLVTQSEAIKYMANA